MFDAFITARNGEPVADDEVEPLARFVLLCLDEVRGHRHRPKISDVISEIEYYRRIAG
jgi:hypothetical protein